jgi:hypothetical protein
MDDDNRCRDKYSLDVHGDVSTIASGRVRLMFVSIAISFFQQIERILFDDTNTMSLVEHAECVQIGKTQDETTNSINSVKADRVTSIDGQANSNVIKQDVALLVIVFECLSFFIIVVVVVEHNE